MTETSYSMQGSLSTYISLHELGEVGVPDVIDMGPLEQSHTPLICLNQQQISIESTIYLDLRTLKASSK